MAKRNEKGSRFLLAALVVLVLQVNEAAGASLIRLFFHDCFVRGCDGDDASLVVNIPAIKSSSASATVGRMTMEQGSPSNAGGGGMLVEVMDAIRPKTYKDQLGINVSCADAVLFATCDGIYILTKGKIVDGQGWKDRVASSAEDTFNLADLAKNLKANGFTDEQLAVLYDVANNQITKPKPWVSVPFDYKTDAVFGHTMAKLRKLNAEDPIFEVGSRVKCGATNP